MVEKEVTIPLYETATARHPDAPLKQLHVLDPHKALERRVQNHSETGKHESTVASFEELTSFRDGLDQAEEASATIKEVLDQVLNYSVREFLDAEENGEKPLDELEQEIHLMHDQLSAQIRDVLWDASCQKYLPTNIRRSLTEIYRFLNRATQTSKRSGAFKETRESTGSRNSLRPQKDAQEYVHVSATTPYEWEEHPLLQDKNPLDLALARGIEDIPPFIKAEDFFSTRSYDQIGLESPSGLDMTRSAFWGRIYDNLRLSIDEFITDPQEAKDLLESGITQIESFREEVESRMNVAAESPAIEILPETKLLFLPDPTGRAARFEMQVEKLYPLKEARDWNRATTLAAMDEVMQGFMQLWKMGKVINDPKPDALMVNKKNQIKVVDPGIITQTDQHPIQVTPGYRPPETYREDTIFVFFDKTAHYSNDRRDPTMQKLPTTQKVTNSGFEILAMPRTPPSEKEFPEEEDREIEKIMIYSFVAGYMLHLASLDRSQGSLPRVDELLYQGTGNKRCDEMGFTRYTDVSPITVEALLPKDHPLREIFVQAVATDPNDRPSLQQLAEIIHQASVEAKREENKTVLHS